jgi:hypothetical protein
VHVPVAVCLSVWAIEAIDVQRRDFLWAGAESVSGTKCKVMQEVVCRPKELERVRVLGITDLHRFGMALRLCWEWHRWSDPPRCWAGLRNKPEKVPCSLLQWRSKWVMVLPLPFDWISGLMGSVLLGSCSTSPSFGQGCACRLCMGKGHSWGTDCAGATGLCHALGEAGSGSASESHP